MFPNIFKNLMHLCEIGIAQYFRSVLILFFDVGQTDYGDLIMFGIIRSTSKKARREELIDNSHGLASAVLFGGLCLVLGAHVRCIPRDRKSVV